MSIHEEITADLGLEVCNRTVDITRNDTALNCVTVARTVAASSARLFSLRDHTPPKH